MSCNLLVLLSAVISLPAKLLLQKTSFLKIFIQTAATLSSPKILCKDR